MYIALVYFALVILYKNNIVHVNALVQNSRVNISVHIHVSFHLIVESYKMLSTRAWCSKLFIKVIPFIFINLNISFI